LGVDERTGEHEQGAGDQGLMFGYATNETPELMPMPILLAHKLASRLADVRKQDIIHYLRPDGKSQVTVEYVNGRPLRVDTIVVACQHSDDVTLKAIREDIIEEVIKPVIPQELLDDENVTYHINPTGRFVSGGPKADCGLTGRKIIVDTYGGVGSHGGGAFSGKDPSKVDRSASYMVRYVAKNIVASGIADKCEVQLSYAIGISDPISILIDTYNTEKIDPERIVEIVRDNFSFKPKAMIEYLDLRRPIYKKTAAYGHFGREEPEFTWERTDMADTLRKDAGL
ncbi:MAG: methionine adenosyltransferase, partial [Nitrospinae bacterium]|nr:methionine adenosyltransferase [Nitrospinota bacterium]